MRIYSTTAAYVASLAQIVIRRHDQLQELSDDDHSIYHTDARALTWLGTRSTDDLAEGSANKYFSGKTQDDLADGATYKRYNPALVAITGGTIDGITVSNLLDKSAAETITGAWIVKNNFSLVFDADSPGCWDIDFYHKRATSPYTAQNGDYVFYIQALGYGTTGYHPAAAIEAVIDGTPGANDMPGRLGFYTTPDGSATCVERMRIDNAGIITLANQSRARAYLTTSTQSITQSSWTKITLNAESYDEQGEFDSATNYRFTAKKAGYYQVNAAVYYAAVDATLIYIAIYKNGASAATAAFRNPTAAGDFSSVISDVIYLAVGDYLELYTYHTSAAAKSVQNGENFTFMSIHKLS